MRERGSQRREAEQAEAEAQQRELNALLEIQQRILDDPASSDEDRALAHKIMGHE